MRCAPAARSLRSAPVATTRDHWADAFAERARAHWTPERTRALLEDKALLLLPGEAAVLLRAIGLLDGDGAMSPAHVRKYRQINHMVMLLASAFTELGAAHAPVRVLDAGCGRSYLSLLLAWCGRHVWRRPIEVLGVDRNPKVIAECQRRAELAQLGDVIRFEARALDGLDVPATWEAVFGACPERVHAVVALHACDTATCDALALGVGLGAELLAVAPCCQAELSRGWAALAERGDAGALAPLWRSPHLRRETAAHLTDAMRTLLVRAAGYTVTAMEFVPVEHTAKNTLIRAVRSSGGPDAAAAAEYRALVEATGGVGLALAGRIRA